jgi:hypothetical protein
MHGRLKSVLRDAEMLGRAIRYLYSRPSYSVLETPGQWLFGLSSGCGGHQIHRHEEDG